MKPFREIRVVTWGRFEPSGTGASFEVRKTDSDRIIRGNTKGILIDREFAAAHQSTLQGFFEHALGMCRLAARRDGIYAVKIDWKPNAVEALEREEFRFIVPAFVISKSGRADKLVSLALTNTAIAGWPTLEELLS